MFTVATPATPPPDSELEHERFSLTVKGKLADDIDQPNMCRRPGNNHSCDDRGVAS